MGQADKRRKKPSALAFFRPSCTLYTASKPLCKKDDFSHYTGFFFWGNTHFSLEVTVASCGFCTCPTAGEQM